MRIQFETDAEALRLDLQKIQKQVPRALESVLRGANRSVGLRATSAHMDTVGRLGIITGALSRGVMADNKNKEGGIVIDIDGSGIGEMTKYVSLPYARVHEYGGVIPITQRMRGFFWHKFYQTADEKWKFMALSRAGSFTIKARPYLRPALADEAQNIVQDVRETFWSLIINA